MIMISDSVRELKRFLDWTSLDDSAHSMVMRMMLAFMLHRGRMSCSRAGGAIRSEAVHRGQITRFLARPRWQKDDFNAPLRAALLNLEAAKGKFLFIIDATLCVSRERRQRTPTARATENDARGRDDATASTSTPERVATVSPSVC